MSHHHHHHHHHHLLPPNTTKLFSSPFREKPDPKQKLPLLRLSLLILLFFGCASFLKLSSFSPPPIPSTTFPNTTITAPPPPPPPCSSLINHGPASSNPIANLLCCDRSHFRTDVCYLLGDIRTAGGGGGRTILLASPDNKTEEKIRPYTRKWEKEIMATVDELTLRRSPAPAAKQCDVRHVAPAVVFSTGGYTGNVYHEFNDGLIPLYITAARFSGEVVLVVVEYHEWWFMKYKGILEKISNYEIVDLKRDKRVHCFDEMIVGLKIHGDLAIDSNLMHNGRSILDFQSLLTAGLTSTPHLPPPPPPPLPATTRRRLQLTILIRHHSRRLLNLQPILHLSHHSGFQPTLLSPKRSTPLSHIHRSLSAADAILAVHGAALTHLLFLRPGSVLIQIIPLGLDWAADTYYGEPARRLGLMYFAYNVTAEESSLSREYGKKDPVLVDTKLVTKKGWAETKRVYMDKQDVELDLKRFGRVIQKARAHLMRLRSKKNIQ